MSFSSPTTKFESPQGTQSSSTNYGKLPSSFTTITQLILVGCLVVVSLTGNSTICILMKRFKSIRTIPNLFLANLAVVDMLNILINIPTFTIVGVLELEETFHGRWVSLAIAGANNLFSILKITSMVATMTDRYIAISWGLQYYVKKTKDKAAIALCVVWLSSIAIALLWGIFAIQIDLGEVPTYKYRIVYFQEIGRYSSAFVYLMFGLAIILLSVLTYCSYRRKSRIFAADSQVTHLNRARTQNEVRAAWTIGLTIAAYLLCYTPSILYAAFTPEDMLSSNEIKWFGFAASYFLFFSSGCNPYIYLVRSTRFRAAVKQLVRKPFGSDDIKLENLTGKLENPTRKLENPTGNLEIPTGELDNPSVKLENATGKLENPTGKLEKPSVNLEKPTGKGEKPSVNLEKPTGKLDNPSVKLENPTGKLDNPSIKLDNPTGELEKPSVKLENPTGKIEKPSEKLEKTTGKLEKPSVVDTGVRARFKLCKAM